MEQINKYKWVLLVVVVALVLTVIAAYGGAEGKEPLLGHPAWLAPLVCLALIIITGGGVGLINQPATASVSVVVCIFCGVLLIVPPPVEELQWYHPLSAATAVGIFANLFLRR